MASSDDERNNRETIGAVAVLFEDVFTACAVEALASIKEGSELTGAPGQPVQSSFLKNSYMLTFPTPGNAEIVSNAEYAAAIEDGVGPHGAMTVRSEVGGFHSVKLTMAGMDKILDHVLPEVARGERKGATTLAGIGDRVIDRADASRLVAANRKRQRRQQKRRGGS